MSTDLVPTGPDSTYALVPHAAALAEQIASTDFAPAGLRGKPMAVMAAMLQGHELGIGAMASLSQISVINGKPCMSAQLMRALVQRAGHELWFKSKTNTRVTICGRRKDWPEDRIAEVSWSMDDAKAAGLQGGQNYRKYPRAMLAARATGELCRDNFADVLGGIGYTPEELTDGDLVADGDLVVEGRADIEPEAPASTRRSAGRAATAKKAPARKAAASKASTPAPAVPEPPLPGEPGFDDPPAPAAPEPDEDIVDGEVIEDDVPATLIESLALVGLTAAKGLRRARELAGEHGHPLPMAIEEVGDEVLELLVADLGLTRPAGGGEDHRDRRLGKMWAMVAEAWPDEHQQTLDGRRKGLISVVTNGRTASSKEMEPAEWDDLFEALEQIADGSMELFQRSTGDHELRTVRTPA
jgi:hypothetical protein